MKKICTNLIMIVIASILVIGCNSDNQTTEPTQKVSEFDQSLYDENIHSYSGLRWETAVESQQYTLYFKAFIQRMLFSADYIWVEGSEEQKDPISVIKQSEDKRNKLLESLLDSIEDINSTP